MEQREIAPVTDLHGQQSRLIKAPAKQPSIVQGDWNYGVKGIEI